SPTATGEKNTGGAGTPTVGTRPGHATSAPATASAGSGASAPAGTDPTTSAPAPTPSSSDDCNRFLWWCS
ncbi:hypothetical protein ACFWNJ_38780, partial [Streptomyces sp. NPDC058398]